jgi:hypothetical protein
MRLNEGDLFAVKTNSFLGMCIRAVQWFWSTDNEAAYNHTGFIIDPNGKTMEARWRFNQFNLADYLNDRILIVRLKDMDPVKFQAGLCGVLPELGDFYPIWRVPLHLFRIAKFFAFGPGVCSEMTEKFIACSGIKLENNIYGLTPDDLADRWRIDRDMEIVFEGVLTRDVLKHLTS